MLDEDFVLNAQNICGNPIRRSAKTAKSPVHDYSISLSHDHSWLIFERRRKALDQIEQTFSPRRYMSAVLDVLW